MLLTPSSSKSINATGINVVHYYNSTLFNLMWQQCW